MRLVILEVLSNPLLGSGDLTADFFPSSGEFDTMICQIPCIPPPSLRWGGGVRHEIDKCISYMHMQSRIESFKNLFFPATLRLWNFYYFFIAS